MARSFKELLTDFNFILKAIVLITGISVNILLLYPRISGSYYSILINGYHLSYLIVIATLVIASIFFEATKITEVCLLAAALIKLFIITSYANIHDMPWHNYEIPLDTVNEYFDGRKDYAYIAFMFSNFVSIIFIVIDVVLRVNKG